MDFGLARSDCGGGVGVTGQSAVHGIKSLKKI